MRLWHQALISRLPLNHLTEQNKECCSLRGRGWGKSQTSINYVFVHSPLALISYHNLVMDEMDERHQHVDPEWHNELYRGKNYPIWNPEQFKFHDFSGPTIYKEHDDYYYRECMEALLMKKGSNKHKMTSYDTIPQNISEIPIYILSGLLYNKPKEQNKPKGDVNKMPKVLEKEEVIIIPQDKIEEEKMVELMELSSKAGITSKKFRKLLREGNVTKPGTKWIWKSSEIPQLIEQLSKLKTPITFK